MQIHKKICAAILSLLLTMFIFSCTYAQSTGMNNTLGLDSAQTAKIDQFIEKHMKSGKIPGMAVVVVKGSKAVYKKGFGYADLKEKRPVTTGTLFELGSNSKAFTALGILKLINSGAIQLNDPIDKYIPFFKARYKGKEVSIRIGHLLHHTSGIPFKTIGDIPPGEGESALEDTVRKVTGLELDHNPGEKFLYATINYDILGLIIKNVSHKTYEDYIKESILKPLGLNNTFMFRDEASRFDMAKGYKYGYLGADEYIAPVYRGNTPAGYVISNIEDMSKWLMIQLGTNELMDFDKSLIEESHVPDRTVLPTELGSSYAAGWHVYQSGSGELSHGGTNPNFYSFTVFRPGDKLGVAVLANINSSYTAAVAQGIIDMLKGKKMTAATDDMLKSLDSVSFTVICVGLPLSAAILYLLITSLIQLIKGKRKLFRGEKKKLLGLFCSIPLIGGFGYCLYHLNDVLYWELPWNFITVWAPETFITAILILTLSVVLFYLYLVLIFLFPMPGEKTPFVLLVLSTCSGLGNALIIFIVNEAVNRNMGTDIKFESSLFLYFILGIVIYILGQKLVRTKLVNITNNLIYDKRMELIGKVLNTSYDKLETIEKGKILAGLNNDTETVSNFANVAINGLTSLITLACCFVYLGVMNIYAFLASVVVIILVTTLYYFFGKSADKLLGQARDIQNIFFKFINDLIGGFKELSIHRGKRAEFKQDMQESCDTYRCKRTRADLKFTDVFIIGELLFTIIIGVVAFVFPVLFTDITGSTLRNYIFVFLYMTGPVHGILSNIPSIIQMKISWKRIRQLADEMDFIESRQQPSGKENEVNEEIKIQLNDVEYRYISTNGETFTVGPFSYEFKSGDIVFITGGNGSGKSTLAKLISGLYSPHKGEILINGKKVEPQDLSKRFSAVFSDFYLFDKLYGVDYRSKHNEIQEYLKTLHIDDKLQIQEGVFSTTKLSTGQRKRMALLASYLEDRPVYLFDEWAADQDPEFRKMFYERLIPELKERGKCVIAITHDDRYFDTADEVIKMEMGRVVDVCCKL
ncbi:cyclic peptide export ABC transporter [Pseudobacteroides cellulosolvens]|uniref:Cyclic peptide transporter n=2 Tax=Pseudobacteroides cellulosolvens TaxID=35825 RepID=A0A0L6JL18_9FIRM|nr:cyclic peptide export ABC transporter [Pseudobacteroides cellulosolvens]KNY26440.1 cyclic peptide transporter [Pseudobacteroides cellulosolvens ATCC 35603 = DSM 2933]